MGNKVRGFTVTLDKDISEEHIDGIVNAIYMIKGVIGVEPEITNIEHHMSDVRSKNEIRSKLYEFIKNELS